MGRAALSTKCIRPVACVDLFSGGGGLHFDSARSERSLENIVVSSRSKLTPSRKWRSSERLQSAKRRFYKALQEFCGYLNSVGVKLSRVVAKKLWNVAIGRKKNNFFASRRSIQRTLYRLYQWIVTRRLEKSQVVRRNIRIDYAPVPDDNLGQAESVLWRESEQIVRPPPDVLPRPPSCPLAPPVTC